MDRTGWEDGLVNNGLGAAALQSLESQVHIVPPSYLSGTSWQPIGLLVSVMISARNWLKHPLCTSPTPEKIENFVCSLGEVW